MTCELLSELSHALKVTSICGLGQVVPAPIVSVLTHFRDMVDQHVIHKVCPAKVCFSWPRVQRPDMNERMSEG